MFRALFPILFFFSCFLTSCQSSVDLHVNASKNLNPDVHRNNSEPVSITVFQLKDLQKFKDANFFQLMDDPEKTLGIDFLGPVDTFMVTPNQKQNISIKLNSNTKYFGVVAAFQSIDNAKWKIFIPLDSKHKSQMTIELKGRNLHLM